MRNPRTSPLAFALLALALALPLAATAKDPPPLIGEAASAAAGDIPDNQVFLTFTNPVARYSVKVPEGWAQLGARSSVTFRDKNNIMRVVVGRGPAPTVASVVRELAGLRGAALRGRPATVTIGGARVVRATYTTRSAANPVTGKRLVLTVDRYYVARGGRRAVVDLGTPVGVDNVDAYRLMIESFRWR